MTMFSLTIWPVASVQVRVNNERYSWLMVLMLTFNIIVSINSVGDTIAISTAIYDIWKRDA